MDTDVFKAILAMDSYNRGYSRGINLTRSDLNSIVNDVGRKLGVAEIFAQDISPTALEAGFYAVAFQWKDDTGTKHTAISNRGTNPDTTSPEGFRASPLVRDIWSGWRIAGGYADASKAQLARRFAGSVFYNKSEV